MGVEVKREINPDLAEQAVQDDEAFVLPDAEALASAPDENSHSGVSRCGRALSCALNRRAIAANLLHFTNIS